VENADWAITPTAITENAVTPAAIGTPRRIVVEVADVRTVPDYVRAGLGVAVIPDHALEPDPALVAVPLAGNPLTCVFSIAISADKPASRPVQTLLELIDEGRTASPDQ
jgi:DNA-binding transcriptional LysR family regulator